MAEETKLEERFRELETDHAVVKTALELHVLECNKRGEFHSRILLVIVCGVIAGVFAQVFHIQIPGS
jgi:hypothetical protein